MTVNKHLWNSLKNMPRYELLSKNIFNGCIYVCSNNGICVAMEILSII